MPRLDLTDAEQLKKVVVEPLISALRAEMKQTVRPLVEELSALRRQDFQKNQRIEAIEQRLSAVERFKMKIAAVSSAVAVVTGIVWRMVLDWVKTRLSKGH